MNTIIKSLTIVALSCGVYTAQAQGLGGMLNKAKSTVSNATGGKGGASGLSSSDITDGLKQALQVGTKNAATKLAAVDGYFGNSLIKVVMPDEAKNVESTLRKAGMGSYVDKAILSMNRAAEDAAMKAVPIFVDAITHMSIQDGLSILKGSNDAATQYLKAKTNAALTSAFRPVISASLDKVNATKYWAEMFSAYNKMPFVKKVNTDLPAYVTERALNGLFVQLAQEESKIRLDPAARVTDLLKKVFGS